MTSHDSESRPARARFSVGQLGIASWPIRRKLIALLAVPLVVGLIAGTAFSWQSMKSYRAASKTSELTSLAINLTEAATQISAEKIQAINVARVITEKGDLAEPKKTFTETVKRTDDLVSALAGQLKAVDDATLGSVAQYREKIETLGDKLISLREAHKDTTDEAVIIDSYNGTTSAGPLQSIQDFLEPLRARVTDVATDPQIIGQVALLDAVRQAESSNVDVGIQIVTALGSNESVSRDDYERLFTAYTTQSNQLDVAKALLLSHQVNKRDQLDVQAYSLEQWVKTVSDLRNKEIEPNDQVVEGSLSDFLNQSTSRNKDYQELRRSITTNIKTLSDAAVRDSLTRLASVVATQLLTLIAVIGLLTLIARTITGPLRRLRVGAGDAAHVNLPKAVAMIERDGPDSISSLPSVLPAGTNAGPETLEVARAVDNLGAEAVRLAASQVRLRHTLDDAFVSMSRRSQSMVEKQLAIIDELESTEEDPDQLRNLFRLDHLAARMRRYNDNLLVLAGSAMRNRTTTPVRVAELFRAATSEMEQYERVRLQPVGGAAVAGTVAGELIHLLAELLDNAAMYSPPTSPIVLSAAFTPEGGLHLEVADSGVGIPQDEIDRLNQRLARSESMDLQAPSRIGLFVVARLARRGGFNVTLRQRTDGNGTVAQVIVPPSSVIGAPNNTGEQPTMAGGAQAPSLGSSTASVGFPAGQGAREAQTTLTPAATEAGAAAAAAAGAAPSGLAAFARASMAASSPNLLAASAEALQDIPSVASSGSYPSWTSQTDQPAATITEDVDSSKALPRRRRGASAAALPQLGIAPPAAEEEKNIFGASAADFAQRPASAIDAIRGSRGQLAEGDGAPLPKRSGSGSTPLGENPLGASTSPSGADLFGGAPQGPATPAPASASSATEFIRPPADPAAPLNPAPAAAASATEFIRPMPEAPGLPTRSGSAPANPAPAAGPAATELIGSVPPLSPAPGTRPNPAPSASPTQPAQQTGPAQPAPGLPEVPRDPGKGGVWSAKSGWTGPIPMIQDQPASLWGNTPPYAGPAPVTNPKGNSYLPASSPASAGYTGDIADELAGRIAGYPAANAPAATEFIGMRPPAGAPAAPVSGPLAPPAPPAGPPVGQVAGPAATEFIAPLAGPNAGATQFLGTPSQDPLTGSAPVLSDVGDSSPIFDSISAWFSDDDEPNAPAGQADQVIDLRDDAPPARTSRWQSLSDQAWLAASAQASSAPEVAGHTEVGLPRRRPGANMVPTAASAGVTQAPMPAPLTVPSNVGKAGADSASSDQQEDVAPAAPTRDANAVRGRLGSYQRGLANARAQRPEISDDEFGTFDSVGAGLFAPNSEDSATDNRGRQGGDR